MKFIVSLFLIAFLSFALALYLPWWTIAIASFLVTALIRQSHLLSFVTGFIAVFLLWSLTAFIISYNNQDILAHKVSQLIVKDDNPLLLVFVTGLTGGLIAGFAALAGSFLRRRPT